MLIAVASVKGSPGVTTFSVALAARWPAAARMLLMECDPSGGDLATRFSLLASPGLVSLAAAARRSGTDPGLIWQHIQKLPGGLPVIAAPTGAEQAHAALVELVGDSAAPLRRAADPSDVVLIADCGRLDPNSAAWPIVRAADFSLLITCAHADDLAHVVARLEATELRSHTPALLLAGAGYGSAEVARELGIPVLGRIPTDRACAALLCGRPGRWWLPGGPSRSALGRCAQTIAETLLSRTTTPSGPLLRVVPEEAPAAREGAQ
jgi:hypothetical protein